MDNKELFENEMKRIAEQFVESLNSYKRYMDKASIDASIGVLCLPKNIEKILIRNRIFRIPDILACDLTKVKGLGISKVGIIAERLSQFLGVQ